MDKHTSSYEERVRYKTLLREEKLRKDAILRLPYAIPVEGSYIKELYEAATWMGIPERTVRQIFWGLIEDKILHIDSDRRVFRGEHWPKQKVQYVDG